MVPRKDGIDCDHETNFDMKNHDYCTYPVKWNREILHEDDYYFSWTILSGGSRLKNEEFLYNQEMRVDPETGAENVIASLKNVSYEVDDFLNVVGTSFLLLNLFLMLYIFLFSKFCYDFFENSSH